MINLLDMYIKSLVLNKALSITDIPVILEHGNQINKYIIYNNKTLKCVKNYYDIKCNSTRCQNIKNELKMDKTQLYDCKNCHQIILDRFNDGKIKLKK